MAKFKFSVIQKILIKSIKTSHRLGDKNLLKNSYAEYIKNCFLLTYRKKEKDR